MRISILAAGALLLNSISALSLYDDYSSRLNKLDSSFSTSGPSLQLLQDYDSLLTSIVGSSSNSKNDTNLLTTSEQKLLLPNLYYKKGLIDLFLGKETKAINDFKSCLSYDDSMSLAKVRLLKLYLIHGKYKEIESFKTTQLNNAKFKKFIESNVEIQQLLKDSNEAQKQISESKQLIDKQKYAECINKISDVVSISPSNAELYKIRAECSIKAALANQRQKSSNPGEHDQTAPEINLRKDLASSLIPDYLTLEQLQPLNIENYVVLSNLYFFGLDEYENAAKHIRKGLHFDMDDKSLKQYSLFFKRNEKLLKLMHKFKTFNAWLFNKAEVYNEDIDINYVSKQDFKEMIKLLFLTKPNMPARDIRNLYSGQEFKNNFEFFSYLDTQFNEKFLDFHESNWKLKFGFGTKKSTAKNHLINGLISDLNKFACESYLMEKQAKNARPYCFKVLEIEKQNEDLDLNAAKEYISEFLPSMVFDIQQLIKNKDFNKLKQIYEKFSDNENLQQFELFKKLYAKIEKMLLKQQEDQQERFRQQQQQRHFQQQQYQQRSRQNTTPKNDYYKILGVAKDANDRDIKTAYRNLVKQYHPDKYKGDDAEHKMAEINKAYEVLSNEDLRTRYNQGDDPNDPAGAGGGGGHPGGSPNPFQNGQFQFNFGGFGGGQHFGGFDFGGFGGGAGPGTNQRGKRRGR